MSYAQRIYSNRTNKTKESAEEKAYRLAQKYNSILRMIEHVNDARTFLQCRNTINSFTKEVGENSLDVMKLTGKLNERIKSVAQDTQKNIDKINAEVEKIKNDKFIEPVEVLQELNTQAEQRLLQFMMQLGANNAGNRRRVGNFVIQADRADAIALMKLATLPQYESCFTTKQKQIIVERSKNPAEVVFEKNKEPLLAEKSSQLGKEYMKSLNLRNALKKVANVEKRSYFKEEAE